MNKKQQLAMNRNWNKFRMSGFCLNSAVMTEYEKVQYYKIMDCLQNLCSSFDNNSRMLGLTPNPIYQVFEEGILVDEGKSKKRLKAFWPDNYLIVKKKEND